MNTSKRGRAVPLYGLGQNGYGRTQVESMIHDLTGCMVGHAISAPPLGMHALRVMPPLTIHRMNAKSQLRMIK